MRIAIVHTDFKIYWPARLHAIQQLLLKNNMDLHIIEIASDGNPYSFAKDDNKNSCKDWSVLFGNTDIRSLKSKDIKKRLFQKLDELQPDVVIAGAIAFYSGALSTYWARKNKKRVIIFDDAKIESVPRGKITNFIKRKIYSAVDAVIYPSNDWIETAQFWGFNKSQFFIGIDVVDNKFWKSDNNKEKCLLFVGRFIPCKNILNLIDKFNEIQNLDGSKLMIVGDGEQKEEVMKLIGSNTNIEYLPFVQQKELKDIYSRASAFIIPSRYDTWGLVINEAMASGLPIWASKECGATSVLVENGVNGVVFNPFDNDDLRSALQKFVDSDINKLSAMGKKSIDIIQKWDLSLLANESFRAIDYVLHAEPRKVDCIAHILLKLWHGRYNQI